jgi:pimeloyl-ACP methyl ester carboxylesterase
LLQDLALAAMRKLVERGGQSGWAATPAGPLRYVVRGPAHAPPLLLLHGLGDSLAGWAQVIGPLARAHRVHLLDLPGHGLSARPPDFRFETLVAAVRSYVEGALETRAAIGARAGTGPTVVGHSLGGWIALRLARTLELSGLQLINPGGALMDRALWEPFRALVSAKDRAGVNRYLAAAFHRAPLALRLFPGEVIAAMEAESARGILDAVVEQDFLTEAELAAVRVPVRLIWGARDRLLPAGTREFFHRGLPHADFVELPATGHLPHLESPRALARALLLPL